MEMVVLAFRCKTKVIFSSFGGRRESSLVKNHVTFADLLFPFSKGKKLKISESQSSLWGDVTFQFDQEITWYFFADPFHSITILLKWGG